MNKFIIMSVASVMACTLTACSPGHNTAGATAVGGVAGGLIASQIGGGFAGVLAGSLIGGSVGYIIGRHMDRQDQANMRSAIVDTPINEQATWTNKKTDTTYVVQPVREYHHRGRYCREYRTKVEINGKWQSAYGKACRQPDGSWKVVK